MLYCDAMTRKQKHILIILGVLNFVVIGALAAIVIRTMTATSAARPTVVRVRFSPCIQRMLDACNALPAPFSETATVAWDPTQLYITLNARYPAPTPPPESAQLLWPALDQIKTVLSSECHIPETITIAVTAHGSEGTVQYLAQLAGQDVAAWMAGTLSEENLAAQSHFRQTSISRDLTDRTN